MKDAQDVLYTQDSWDAVPVLLRSSLKCYFLIRCVLPSPGWGPDTRSPLHERQGGWTQFPCSL